MRSSLPQLLLGVQGLQLAFARRAASVGAVRISIFLYHNTNVIYLLLQQEPKAWA